MDAVELCTKIFFVEIRRRWLMFWMHPNNFITTWRMNRRAKRMAKDLLAEIHAAQESSVNE